MKITLNFKMRFHEKYVLCINFNKNVHCLRVPHESACPMDREKYHIIKIL